MIRIIGFISFLCLFSQPITVIGNANALAFDSIDDVEYFEMECDELIVQHKYRYPNPLREIGRSMLKEEAISLLQCLSYFAAQPEESFDQFNFNYAPILIASNFYYNDKELLFDVISSAREDVEMYLDENMSQLSLQFDSLRINDMIFVKKYKLYRNIVTYSMSLCIAEEDKPTFQRLFETEYDCLFVGLRNGVVAQLERAIESELISHDYYDYLLLKLNQMLIAEEEWLEKSPPGSGNQIYHIQRSNSLIRRIMDLVNRLSG